MVSFLVVFRELAIVRKSLLTNKDGIFGRDTSLSQMPAGAILDMKKFIGSVVVRELQVLRVP
ncbi:MAG: hypothetical protein ACYSUB_21975, partial [Planctomycetota bacterium]